MTDNTVLTFGLFLSKVNIYSSSTNLQPTERSVLQPTQREMKQMDGAMILPLHSLSALTRKTL